MPSPGFAEIAATLCLGLAILQAFVAKRFQHWAGLYPAGSAGRRAFHLMGEVEIAFGFWAALYLFS